MSNESLMRILSNSSLLLCSFSLLALLIRGVFAMASNP